MDKGCVLCEIQTKVLCTVRTNVRLQGVCHGSGAEGRFRARSGHIGWWAHCHWDGFTAIRFSSPLPCHLCYTFGFLSKAITGPAGKTIKCDALSEIDEHLEWKVVPFHSFQRVNHLILV